MVPWRVSLMRGCPLVGGSIIGGSTVYLMIHRILTYIGRACVLLLVLGVHIVHVLLTVCS